MDVAFCSTMVAEVLGHRADLSIDAAISLIDDAVSSAAAARSSALPDTLADRRAPSRSATPTSARPSVASASASRVDALDRRRHLVDRRRHLLGGGGHSAVVAVDALDRRARLLHRRSRSGRSSDGQARRVGGDLLDRRGHLVDAGDQLLGRRGDRLGLARRSRRSDAAMPLELVERVVERPDLRFGAVRRPRRRCARCWSPRRSPASAWPSTSRGSNAGVRRCRCCVTVAVAAVRLRVAITVSSCVTTPPGSDRSCSSSASRLRITIRRSPIVAMPARYCAPTPDSASPGGWIAAGGIVRNSRQASTSRPTLRPCSCTTSSRVEVGGGALEAEARAHVDRRHDLAAREHHAVDERRGVRHARHLLHHLDVRDVLAGQRVGRAGDDEQDVVVGASSCDLPHAVRPRRDRRRARGAPPRRHRESAPRGRRRGRSRRRRPRRESADRRSSARRSRAGRRCGRRAGRPPPAPLPTTNAWQRAPRGRPECRAPRQPDDRQRARRGTASTSPPSSTRGSPPPRSRSPRARPPAARRTSARRRARSARR